MDGLNNCALKLLQRRHLMNNRTILFSCLLASIVCTAFLSAYCSRNIKLPWKSFPQILSSRRRIPWTRTTDASQKCDESHLNLDEFYINGSVFCKTSVVVVFNETNEFNKSFGESLYIRRFRCPRHPVISSFNLPKTGLASYPGSGNTWARHLLQQMTGIQAGAIYTAVELLNRGFPGEGQEENVIVVKTHLTAVERSKFVEFERQILLLRNPFEAFASEYKRSHLAAGHHKHVNITINEDWQSYIKSNIRSWSYFVRVALSFPYSQIIVFYEDMKNCLLRELMNIASFLKTSTFNKFSVCCALTFSRGRNYRNQSQVNISSLYSKQHIQELNEMIRTLSEDIEKTFPVLAERLLEYVQNVDD